MSKGRRNPPAIQAPAESNYIRAYHGSPHDFDKFDASKIGTGEGAQAYGHGMYFAGSEDVARSYREALKTIVDRPVPRDLQNAYIEASAARSDFANRRGLWLQKNPRIEFPQQAEMDANETLFYDLQNRVNAAAHNPGRMYEVAIDRPESSLLDWDAPISRQPKVVQKVFSDIAMDQLRDGRRIYRDIATRHGEAFDDDMTGILANLEASKELLAEGVPGIRYLDQGSRRVGQGTRNYVMFPGTEDLIRILRKYAVPGAIGAGAAAGSAFADDRYGDGLSGFAMPQPMSSEPSFDDRAGIAPDDTLATRAFKRSGQFVADRTDEIGGYASKKAGELGDYVSKRAGVDLDPEEMAQFQSNLPREHRHFSFAVDEAMQMPVVRAGPHTLSPSKYLEVAARASGLSELSVQNAIASIKGLPFDQADEAAVALRDNLLTQMRTNLPNRFEDGAIDTEFDTGATPEQAAEFDRDGVLEGRYRLTPQGEQGYQSERAYNLFSTFQNGTHRPIGSDRASKGLALAGSAILGAAGDAKGAGETARLMGNRMNTPAGRMGEALYWYERGTPDGTSGDSLSGAKYPSLSSTTFDGVTTKMTNADNLLPRYSQQLSERFLYNLDMPSANMAALDQMRDDFYRTTPRYPAGSDPKEVRGLIRELKDLDSEARQYASVEYPAFVQKYGLSPEAFGGGLHDFTGRKYYPEKPIAPVKPTYLSPFGEMMANYPRDMADAQGIAELGLAGATGGASLLGSLVNERSLAAALAKTARSVAKGGFKAGSNAVGETPTNWAMAEVNRPAESLGFFDPPEYNPLVTDPAGNPVRADDPNYRTYKQSAYDKRDSRLQRILDAGTKMYGRSQPSPRRPFDD